MGKKNIQKEASVMATLNRLFVRNWQLLRYSKQSNFVSCGFKISRLSSLWLVRFKVQIMNFWSCKTKYKNVCHKKKEKEKEKSHGNMDQQQQQRARIAFPLKQSSRPDGGDQRKTEFWSESRGRWMPVAALHATWQRGHPPRFHGDEKLRVYWRNQIEQQ